MKNVKSEEDLKKIDNAMKHRDRAREAGIKDVYTSNEIHSKLRSSTNKGDISAMVNNSPDEMKGKMKSVISSALSSSTNEEFNASSGGSDYKMMSNNEKEFIAKMVLRMASFKYGAAAEIFQDMSVSQSKERNDSE